MRHTIPELSRMDLIGLRGLYLRYYAGQGRACFEVISGGWVPSPQGRIPIIPWDRDRLIKRIWDYEKAHTTKTGKVIDPLGFAALVREAERGYDVVIGDDGVAKVVVP